MEAKWLLMIADYKVRLPTNRAIKCARKFIWNVCCLLIPILGWATRKPLICLRKHQSLPDREKAPGRGFLLPSFASVTIAIAARGYMVARSSVCGRWGRGDPNHLGAMLEPVVIKIGKQGFA
jgi:hypothetical protein